jgi:hypothetical protein
MDAPHIFLKGSGIEAGDICSLQLLLSGESISIGRSQRLLSSLLENSAFEGLFLDHSKSDIQMNLSELEIERRMDLESADLSVEVLDSLLLSESISVESEDAPLRFILNRGAGYRDLLR